MLKLPYYKIQLTEKIAPWEVRFLRSAIADTVGKESVLYSNHLAEGGYRHGTPLIQYKRVLGLPTILFLGEAVEVAHLFFEKGVKTLRLGEREIACEIKNFQPEQLVLQVWDNFFSYKIHDYSPFREENLAKFEAMRSMAEKLSFLEKLLCNHIVTFLVNMGFEVFRQKEEKRVVVRILDFENKERTLPYRDINWRVFDLTFEVNVALPNYVGLGNHVSEGFGIIKQINQ